MSSSGHCGYPAAHGTSSRVGRTKIVSLAVASVGALAALAALASCEGDARPQIVLSVDMDMPTFAQLDPASLDAGLSADAVVDTLRIEVLDADNHPLPGGTKQLTIASPADLPVSFGVASSASARGHVTVRVRAFRAALAVPGMSAGQVVLDPFVDATVDRLVTLELPTEGVVRRKVVLRGDCIGTRGRFPTEDDEGATCIDASRPRGAPSDGVEDAPEPAVDAAPPASVAGTWALAHDVPCPGAPPSGTRCVPGGFFLLGDPQYVGIGDLYDSMPLRPVVVSPVFMDETEVTVGALRALQRGGYTGPVPYAPSQGDVLGECTWEDASSGDLPLNCVEEETAIAICERRGARLPTEAEWEHAARGRGQRRLFVWGQEAPQCCSLIIGRDMDQDCSGPSPDVVGAHPGSDACVGDASRDGVLDLNGNVAELVADIAVPFDADCWRSTAETAVLTDPVCTAGGSIHVARGAAWNTPIGNAPVPGRRPYGADHGFGFRCVFDVDATP